jgi:mono/diheme cytochrome c family protein
VGRSTIVRLVALLGLAALLLGALAAFGFIKSGLYNVGASKPHTPLTWWVTNETMIHSVKRHAKGIAQPQSFTPEQVVRGFCAYETHCVACHGAPAVARQHWAEGMEPAPPYLLDAPQRFTSPQLFWIAKNGIKMTGMPSWRASMSDAQLWDVVAFLEAMPKMPPPTYVQWRGQRRCGSAAPAVAISAP